MSASNKLNGRPGTRAFDGAVMVHVEELSTGSIVPMGPSSLPSEVLSGTLGSAPDRHWGQSYQRSYLHEQFGIERATRVQTLHVEAVSRTE